MWKKKRKHAGRPLCEHGWIKPNEWKCLAAGKMIEAELIEQKCDPTEWKQPQWAETDTEKPTDLERGITNTRMLLYNRECRKVHVETRM